MIMALELPTKQKVVICFLFAGGLFTCAAGVARILTTWKATTCDDSDLTWNYYLVILTSSLELFVGIVRIVNLVKAYILI